jgi:hypothetical protein
MQFTEKKNSHPVMKLKEVANLVCDEPPFQVKGRGLVYLIKLEDNNLPVYRSQWSKLLMNQNVRINGEAFTVRGIESYATHEDMPHKSIGLLVLKIQGEPLLPIDYQPKWTGKYD